MRILLIDNLILPEEGSLALLDVHPHLGLLAVAAVAESAGHSVEILDPKRLIRAGDLPYDSTVYPRAAAMIRSRRPDLVGFTALGCSCLFAIRVAELLRRAEPDLPIFLGGPHATMLHREILERFRQFDVIVRYEADETFPDILERLGNRDFGGIPGLSWRPSPNSERFHCNDGNPMVRDLDRLPLASYDHYPVADLGLNLLRIEAGRGCPFQCTFCSTAGFFQRSFRIKSAERLVLELDRLHARYHCSEFKLDHDLFTVNRRKVLEFCDAVKSRGYRWRVSARVDCVDDELLRHMADAGCIGLYFGIETGSARMQEISRKRLDLTRVQPILERADQLGIETTASFITGYPEETQPDLDATLDLVGTCYRRSCLTQLHMLAPEPGTPLFEARGSSIRYDGYGGRYNTEPVDTTDQSLLFEHPQIFQTYYHYPTELPRDHVIFTVESVDLVRRAGPIVLNYLLRAFDGRLSVFLRQFEAFASAQAAPQTRETRPDADQLLAFLGSRLGPRHHLTSLFRFSLAIHAGGLERHGPPPDSLHSEAGFDGDTFYRLADDVTVLSNLHDCAALLQRIHVLPPGTGLLDDRDAGPRGTWLVKPSGTTSATCRLTPGLVAVISLFETPQRGTDVLELVQAAGGSPNHKADWLETLAHHRFLVPCSDVLESTNAAPEAAIPSTTTA